MKIVRSMNLCELTSDHASQISFRQMHLEEGVKLKISVGSLSNRHRQRNGELFWDTVKILEDHFAALLKQVGHVLASIT